MIARRHALRQIDVDRLLVGGQIAAGILCLPPSMLLLHHWMQRRALAFQFPETISQAAPLHGHRQGLASSFPMARRFRCQR
ncbi:MAG: hypothetical protein U1A72_23030 [Sulfuritalea sp.]|nr:hypothetical protein [Sulfuritalea sp.]